MADPIIFLNVVLSAELSGLYTFYGEREREREREREGERDSDN